METSQDNSKAHVHDIFESVAESYDAANNRISLGRHTTWKQALIDAVSPFIVANNGVLLDVCCGTGDITQRAAQSFPQSLVVGLDFSAEMLHVAQKRCEGLSNVLLVEGDAMRLPFTDNTFNAAVISFGLRNTPSYEHVVREMYRVVKPGGMVACLDASVPDCAIVKPFYHIYYKYIMTALGGGRKKRDEYKWLYQSTQDFLTKQQLLDLFKQCGLQNVSVSSFMFGAAALHVGYVPCVKE